MADTRALSPILRTVSGGIFTQQNPVAQPREKLLDANEISLRRVSNQLSTLTVQMNSISQSLDRVAFFTQQDTSIEQLKTKQDQDQQRRIAEEGIRTKEEGIIENKIKSALVAPVRRIAQKTQSVLSKLMEFFATLLGGWLLIKGIQTLKALSEGNTTKLEEIRDSVIKNLGIAGVTLYLLNGGFFKISRTIASITKNIIKGLGNLIFVKPFQLLLQQISKITPKPIIAAAEKVGGGLVGLGRMLNKFVGPVVSGAIMAGIDIAGGEDPGRAIAGAIGGTAAAAPAFALASIVPIPGTGVVAGALAYGKGEKITKDFYDSIMGTKPKEKPEEKPKVEPVTPAMPPKPSMQGNGTEDENRSPDISAQVETPSSPAETEVPPPSPEMVQKFEMAWENRNKGYARKTIENAWNNMSPVEKQQAQIWAKSKGHEWSEMNLPAYTPPQTQMQGTPQAQITPIPVSEMQQRSEQLNTPLAEPKPTVVVARSSSGGGQDTGASQLPPIGESASNVPSISSSNPENFYTLYSQVHYNVVM